jgi:hypothetical protein
MPYRPLPALTFHPESLYSLQTALAPQTCSCSLPLPGNCLLYSRIRTHGVCLRLQLSGPDANHVCLSCHDAARLSHQQADRSSQRPALQGRRPILLEPTSRLLLAVHIALWFLVRAGVAASSPISKALRKRFVRASRCTSGSGSTRVLQGDASRAFTDYTGVKYGSRRDLESLDQNP